MSDTSYIIKRVQDTVIVYSVAPIFLQCVFREKKGNTERFNVGGGSLPTWTQKQDRSQEPTTNKDKKGEIKECKISDLVTTRKFNSNYELF